MYAVDTNYLGLKRNLPPLIETINPLNFYFITLRYLFFQHVSSVLDAHAPKKKKNSSSRSYTGKTIRTQKTFRNCLFVENKNKKKIKYRTSHRVTP